MSSGIQRVFAGRDAVTRVDPSKPPSWGGGVALLAIGWILAAIVVLIFFGSLLLEVLHTLGSRVSWQAHLCGFPAGVAVAALLHLRRGASRRRQAAVVS